jgi:phosphoglucosamine mutase
MDRLFGTDGMRAAAGEFPLDTASVYCLGRALAGLLRAEADAPRVLLGRDTRESGPWLEAALAGGLRAGGGQPVSAGVVPTSAVALLTKRHGFAAGVVISASHNPYQDNGIKIFSAAGVKIADDREDELEAAVRRGPGASSVEPLALAPDPAYLSDYVSFLSGLFGRRAPGQKLRLILDCANGAAAGVAPALFRSLGFEVTALHAAPDGRNINSGCGSLHPDGLGRAVREAGADFGIAYDGDADRAVWADETGLVLNGDHTLYVQALYLQESGRLRGGAVVATTMSNMGLERALAARGLELVRTCVGDKFVHDEMEARGANLGGERSGHTIFLDDCPTGDGLLTSLKMLETRLAKGAPFSVLAAGLVEFPQVLINVRVRIKPELGRVPDVAERLGEARRALGEEGRIELRYSGTEPVVRVMVEGRDAAAIKDWARRLAEAIERNLGA